LHKNHEVLVLGENHRLCPASLVENIQVLGLAQAKVPNGNDVDFELPPDPRTQLRGNLGVQPQNHAAITG